LGRGESGGLRVNGKKRKKQLGGRKGNPKKYLVRPPNVNEYRRKLQKRVTDTVYHFHREGGKKGSLLGVRKLLRLWGRSWKRECGWETCHHEGGTGTKQIGTGAKTRKK